MNYLKLFLGACGLAALFMAAIIFCPGAAFLERAEAAAPVDGSESKIISRFVIEEGNNVNYFLLSPVVACHVLVTNEANPRILINFPAGNSGVALWFDASNNENLRLHLVGEPLPGSASANSQSVQFQVATNRKSILLTSFMLDSVRQIRNFGKPEAMEVALVREKFCRAHDIAKALKPYAVFAVFKKSGSSPQARQDFRDLVVLRRLTLKNQAYILDLRLPSHVKARASGQAITLVSTSEEPVSFEARAEVPFRPLTPYEPSALFSKKTLEFREKLRSEAKEGDGAAKTRFQRFDEALRNLGFLSYREKYLAGSWRFMTYFGRDTILSLLMLNDSVTPGAYRDGIQSIVDRLDREGSVAHEEDIGSWAEYRAIEAVLAKQGSPLPGDFEKPFYDYKMIDDDFLFPIMERGYFLDRSLSADEKKKFMRHGAAVGEENGAAMLRNWNYVIAHALPFGKSKAGTKPAPDAWKNLIRIAPGQMVGDWRDSPDGLGRGTYPASVNIDIVAESLQSIKEMITSGPCEKEELKTWASAAQCKEVSQVIDNCATPEGRARFDELVKAWRNAKNYFRVNLGPDEIRARLRSYMEGGLSEDERAYFLSRNIEKGVTFREFIYGGRIPSCIKEGLVFNALSLDEKGVPVPIESSDLSFRLFLCYPDPGEIEQALRLIELPFPLGLRSDAGIFVANPALSVDPLHWKALSRRAYHGTVIWSWQIYMLELGLARQIERFEKISGQQALVSRLKKDLRDIKSLRESVGGLANSELWSYVIEKGIMVPSAFGPEAGSHDESNAVQLWSTIVPAVMMKEESILGKGSH
jgi:hypothetical protein